MRLYFYASTKFDTSDYNSASFIKTLKNFLEDIDISLNLKEANVFLLAGTGKKIRKKIKWARKHNKKIIYFLSPIEEFFNEFSYIVYKRQELALARCCDYIIATTSAEKELLISGGYPTTFLLKGMISNNWVNIADSEKQIFLKKLESPYEKLIVGCGLVNHESTGISDFIALAQAFPAYQFVYLNTSEAEKNITKLQFELPRNIIYIPYNIPTLIRGAFAAADIICFTSYNPIRQYKIYQALACGKPVIVRDFNLNYENLIANVTAYKCSNIEQYWATIKTLVETNNKLAPIPSYLEVNGKEEFANILKEVYEK